MIQANEIIMVVLGLGVLVFMFMNYSNLERIPSFRVLAIAFCTFVTGWLLTVLEGFFWLAYLNFLEHMCYAAGAIIMAMWFWNVFGKTEECK